MAIKEKRKLKNDKFRLKTVRLVCILSALCIGGNFIDSYAENLNGAGIYNYYNIAEQSPLYGLKSDGYFDFNVKPFEMQGFSLKAYKKGDAIKLHYVHKATGAQFVFDLADKQNSKYNTIFFGCPAEDDMGRSHALEHLLASPVFEVLLNKYGRLSDKQFNGQANEFGFHFIFSQDVFGSDLEVLKSIFDELNNPTFLRDNNALFNKEIYSRYGDDVAGRMYNEVLTNKTSSDDNDSRELRYLRKFDYGGVPEEVLKITTDDMKNYFNKYIHPSNMLVSCCCGKNSEQVKKVLKFIQENYLNNFGNKAVKLKYKPRVDKNSRYVRRKWSLDSKIFKSLKDSGKNFVYDNVAEICFDVDDFDVSEKDALFMSTNLAGAIASVQKELESKGYGFMEIISDDVLKGYLKVRIYGSDKNKFGEGALKNNVREVLVKLSEVLRQMIERDGNEEMVYNANKLVVEKYWKGINFNTPDRYRKIYKMYDLNFLSYIKYKDPFSEKIFQIKNGEILDDEQTFKNNYLNKLTNVVKKLSGAKVKYVDVFEKSKNVSENNKTDSKIRGDSLKDVPIKFKNYKNKDVLKCAEYVLLRYIVNPKLEDYGLSYRSLSGAPYVGAFPQIETNETSKKSINNFLSKEFYRLLNEFNFTQNIYEAEVNKYSQDLRRRIDEFKNCSMNFKNHKNFIENAIRNKNTNFSREKLFYDLEKLIKKLKMFFETKQEYMEYKKTAKGFKEKYKKYFDEYFNDDSDYSKFNSNFLDYLNFYISIFEKSITILENMLRNISNLTYEDVNEAIKSAYLVK